MKYRIIKFPKCLSRVTKRIEGKKLKDELRRQYKTMNSVNGVGNLELLWHQRRIVRYSECLEAKFKVNKDCDE